MPISPHKSVDFLFKLSCRGTFSFSAFCALFFVVKHLALICQILLYDQVTFIKISLYSCNIWLRRNQWRNLIGWNLRDIALIKLVSKIFFFYSCELVGCVGRRIQVHEHIVIWRSLLRNILLFSFLIFLIHLAKILAFLISSIILYLYLHFELFFRLINNFLLSFSFLRTILRLLSFFLSLFCFELLLLLHVSEQMAVLLIAFLG